MKTVLHLRRFLIGRQTHKFYRWLLRMAETKNVGDHAFPIVRGRSGHPLRQCCFVRRSGPTSCVWPNAAVVSRHDSSSSTTNMSWLSEVLRLMEQSGDEKEDEVLQDIYTSFQKRYIEFADILGFVCARPVGHKDLRQISMIDECLARL